jgi:hypothetical protein
LKLEATIEDWSLAEILYLEENLGAKIIEPEVRYQSKIMGPASEAAERQNQDPKISAQS